MNKKILATILAGSALLLGTASSIAAPVNPKIPDETKNEAQFSNASAPISITAKLHQSGFVSQRGGSYRINKNLAIEGSYMKVGLGSKLKQSNVQEKEMTQISAKAIIPLKKGFNVFGKAGMANLSSRDQSVMSNITTTQNSLNNYNKIVPYYGAGVGYSVSDKTSFDLQMSGTPQDGSLPATNATTVGVTYNF